MLHETMSYSCEPTINDEKLFMAGRLTPIGGASSDTDYDQNYDEEHDERAALIQEHEKLNASLAALTCHFAHVQLRLQQVISAPSSEDRENLLLELHEFASNGIPDVMCQTTSALSNEQLIQAEKLREKECINELKQKLDEVEHYAVASGLLEGAPTSVMLEKQRILIDELRNKLDLQLDDKSVSKLSADELRQLVDQSIYQLTNPVKLKEKLIKQMRTQITDLEEFIEFLKADAAKAITGAPIEAAPSKNLTTTEVSTPIPTKLKKIKMETRTTAAPPTPDESAESYASCFPFRRNPLNILQPLKKLVILTQLYTIFLFTCGTRVGRRKTHPTTTTVKKDLVSQKHYGDIRAKLEIAIANVLQAVQSQRRAPNGDDDDGDDDEQGSKDSPAVISAVRHQLVPALRALLEHGLYETNYTSTMSLWVCLPILSANEYSTKENTHAWQLFLKYYDMKKGGEFANSPARKLSQSFSLDIVGGKPITPKENLLSAIDTIARLHKRRINEMDACFKAFVCHALNEKRLVSFLRLIMQTGQLIESHYLSWSYTKLTSFSDALHSLNRLTDVHFHLPLNASTQRFNRDQELFE